MLNGLRNIGQAAGNLGKMRQLQKMLKEVIVEGRSKNGKVIVKINGEQKIIDIYIDPELVNFVSANFYQPETDDEEQIQRSYQKGQKFFSSPIIEAVEDAMKKVQAAIVQKVQESGSMGELMGMLQGGMGGA